MSVANVQQSTSLSALKNPVSQVEVKPGFDTLQGFELIQRAATLLSSSTIVPTQYRKKIIKKDKYGNILKSEDNENALPNSVIALNMANRMGADPLMIMQNLYIVEGRPSWSSQYIIASINACGKYSPLRFEITSLGEQSIEYTETYWENNRRQERAHSVKVEDMQCIAWALEKSTGERLESPPVRISMAIKEGWYTKNGSKWQTMPEVMLRYRAASFFGKIYAPELLMGLSSMEEQEDTVFDLEPVQDGGYQVVSMSDLKKEETEPEEVKAEDKTAPKPAKAKKSKSEVVVEVESAETRAKKAATPAPKVSAKPEPEKVIPPQTEAPTLHMNEETGEVASDPYVVPCPNKGGANVNEIDCAGCPNRQGCPSWD